MAIEQVLAETGKQIFVIINNLFEIERKMLASPELSSLSRHIERMKEGFSELGYYYENPMGQEFKETRTDLEASISGQATENLVVVEVIKPIIRGPYSKVVQRGIVVVKSANEE